MADATHEFKRLGALSVVTVGSTNKQGMVTVPV